MHQSKASWVNDMMSIIQAEESPNVFVSLKFWLAKVFNLSRGRGNERSANIVWYLYSFRALFVLYEAVLDNTIGKAINWLVNSTLNFTRKTDIALIAILREKPISHESRRDECDIGFSSEISRGIHESGNGFSLNRITF